MTEDELQRAAIEAATLHGWLHYHAFDSRRSAPGFPDCVFVKPPRVLFVEFKSERGRLRAEQKVWLDALEGCDTIASGVVRPDDLDDLLAALLR